MANQSHGRVLGWRHSSRGLASVGVGPPPPARWVTAIEEREPTDAIPESPPERLRAAALMRQGLARPSVQHVVRDSSGGFVARVDLAYPQDRILIEYESFEHHTGKLALVRDSVRRNALTELGFVVLSATADLRDDARRLATSLRAIRGRAA
jgi:hypothetical protein